MTLSQEYFGEGGPRIPIKNSAEKPKAVTMLEDTRKRIIHLLNDYLAGMPEFTNVEFKDIMEHANEVLTGMPELANLHEDTRPRELALVYKNIYKKLPHPKDWDPSKKNDDEIIAILIKRFGMPADK